MEGEGGNVGRVTKPTATTSRGKKMARKEILIKKKQIDEIIKAARSDNDPLSSFPHFRYYLNNGLSVYLDSGHGDKLSSQLKQYIQNLLRMNMEVPYGSEWQIEEKVKRREMVASEAHYIFVHEALNSDANQISEMVERESTSTWNGSMVGFVHYRFIVEEEVPVLYVYELQLEHRVQGKGLGKFLMQLLELIACKYRMGAIMLTVQKANVLAMNVYVGKLRMSRHSQLQLSKEELESSEHQMYIVSATSPSRVHPLLGHETSYEILCKAFDPEAKAILEGS